MSELALATETEMVLLDIQERMSNPEISPEERVSCIARLRALADKVNPDAGIPQEVAS